MHAVLAAAAGLTIIAATGVFGTQGVSATSAFVSVPPLVSSSATILI